MTPNPNVQGSGHGSGATAHSARWLLFVGKAAAFLAIALVGTEALWRGLRYLPAKSDLINFARLRKAADGDPNVVALLGSSRVRFGLFPQALDSAVPGRRFLQLGILGNSPMPVLEDLARDPNFRGLVICEFNPAHWAGSSPYTNPPEALAYTRPKVSGAYLETLLAEQVRERFSFFSFNLFTEAPRIIQHKIIPAPEEPDRFVRSADLGPTVNAHLLLDWERGAREAAEWVKRTGSDRIVPDVEGLIARIRQRGGDVAFVRMPVDGELRTLEESIFPQTQSLMRELRARGEIVIDFADMPEHFYCPDGSHLETPGAERFSKLLGEALAARGFFSRQAAAH